MGGPQQTWASFLEFAVPQGASLDQKTKHSSTTSELTGEYEDEVTAEDTVPPEVLSFQPCGCH